MRTLDIPHSTGSHIYRDYLMEDITAHHEHSSNLLHVLNDLDQKRIVKIVCGKRQVTLA